jgi:hypothetical protein
MHDVGHVFTQRVLIFFAKGEGKDEPSPKEQTISKGIEEKKNFQYLKFSEGLSGGIVVQYATTKANTMPSTLNHKTTKL